MHHSYIERLLERLAERCGGREIMFYNLVGFGLPPCMSLLYVVWSVTLLGLNVAALGCSLGSEMPRDVGQIAEIVHSMLYFVGGGSCIVLMAAKRSDIALLLRQAHLYPDYGSTMADFSIALRDRTASLSRTIRNAFSIVTLLAFITAMFAPLVQFYFAINGTVPALPFPHSFRLVSQPSLNYALMCTLQFVGVLPVYFIIFGFDSILITSTLKFETHVQLLTRALALIPERTRLAMATTQGVDQPQEVRHRIMLSCLNQCIQHHVAIYRLFDIIQSIYAVFYVCVVLYCMWAICLSGVVLVLHGSNTALVLKFTMNMIIELIILFTHCWSGERIAAAGESVRDAVYASPWLELPPSCHRSMRIVMERTKKPLRIKSITGHDASLQVFTTVINLSYTYFNIILAMRK